MSDDWLSISVQISARYSHNLIGFSFDNKNVITQCLGLAKLAEIAQRSWDITLSFKKKLYKKYRTSLLLISCDWTDAAPEGMTRDPETDPEWSLGLWVHRFGTQWMFFKVSFYYIQHTSCFPVTWFLHQRNHLVFVSYFSSDQQVSAVLIRSNTDVVYSFDFPCLLQSPPIITHIGHSSYYWQTSLSQCTCENSSVSLWVTSPFLLICGLFTVLKNKR